MFSSSEINVFSVLISFHEQWVVYEQNIGFIYTTMLARELKDVGDFNCSFSTSEKVSLNPSSNPALRKLKEFAFKNKTFCIIGINSWSH